VPSLCKLKKGTCYEAAALGMKPQQCIYSSSPEDVCHAFIICDSAQSTDKESMAHIPLQMSALQNAILENRPSDQEIAIWWSCRSLAIQLEPAEACREDLHLQLFREVYGRLTPDGCPCLIFRGREVGAHLQSGLPLVFKKIRKCASYVNLPQNPLTKSRNNDFWAEAHRQQALHCQSQAGRYRCNVPADLNVKATCLCFSGDSAVLDCTWMM